MHYLWYVCMCVVCACERVQLASHAPIYLCFLLSAGMQAPLFQVIQKIMGSAPSCNKSCISGTKEFLNFICTIAIPGLMQDNAVRQSFMFRILTSLSNLLVSQGCPERHASVGSMHQLTACI